MFKYSVRNYGKVFKLTTTYAGMTSVVICQQLANRQRIASFDNTDPDSAVGRLVGRVRLLETARHLYAYWSKENATLTDLKHFSNLVALVRQLCANDTEFSGMSSEIQYADERVRQAGEAVSIVNGVLVLRDFLRRFPSWKAMHAAFPVTGHAHHYLVHLPKSVSVAIQLQLRDLYQHFDDAKQDRRFQNAN